MSFYLHTSGKRGRPTRFDDKNLAVLTAIASVLDARQRVRGRKPSDTMMAVVETPTCVTITDTWTELTFYVYDSVKVEKAHRTLPRHGDTTPIAASTVAAIKKGCADSKAGKVTAVKVTASGEVKKVDLSKEPSFVPAPRKTLAPRAIDLSKVQGKLAMLQKEVVDKKLVTDDTPAN